MQFLVSALAMSAGCLCAVPAWPQESPQSQEISNLPAPDAAGPLAAGHWRLIYSPATYHYSRDPEHRYVWMLGAERHRADGLLFGAAYFRNSFGQPSAYAYGGQRLEGWSHHPQLFAQWTAGVMYGYKDSYADKVPLNYRGFSPGMVLSFGWQFTPVHAAQLNVLGNSALMFQWSMELP